MSTGPHFVLVGHEGCHNRGCEALARMAIHVLSEQWPGASFSVVSSFPEHDAPLAAISNVDIVPGIGVLAPMTSQSGRKATLGQRIRYRAGRIAGACWPSLGERLNPPVPEPRPVREADFHRTRHLMPLYKSATAVISVGGDLFIEDYGPPAMAMEQLELAQYMGVPALIWGASIWPLKTGWIEERLRALLTACTLVSVRDDSTIQYLSSLGVTSNVARIADGAFLMPARAPVPDRLSRPRDAKWIVGLNGSSLMSSYLSRVECQRVLGEMVAFFDELSERDGATLYLIPHDGPPGAREREFLSEFRQLLKRPDKAFLLPAGLDGPQTKYYIGQLDVFIAMRFHPSIAALSQGIPTLGLAHSPKFRGLHEMVFGHDRYLLDYDAITRESLKGKIDLIRSESAGIRAFLARRVPELQASAREAGRHAAAALSSVGKRS